MIAVNGGYVYFPKMLRSIVQKFIVQGLLLKDVWTELEIETLQNSENEKEATDIGVIYEHLSAEVEAKIEGNKLLVRWIYGLKLNSIIGMLHVASGKCTCGYYFLFLFSSSVVAPENQEDSNSKLKRQTNYVFHHLILCCFTFICTNYKIYAVCDLAMCLAMIETGYSLKGCGSFNQVSQENTLPVSIFSSFYFDKLTHNLHFIYLFIYLLHSVFWYGKPHQK